MVASSSFGTLVAGFWLVLSGALGVAGARVIAVEELPARAVVLTQDPSDGDSCVGGCGAELHLKHDGRHWARCTGEQTYCFGFVNRVRLEIVGGACVCDDPADEAPCYYAVAADLNTGGMRCCCEGDLQAVGSGGDTVTPAGYSATDTTVAEPGEIVTVYGVRAQPCTDQESQPSVKVHASCLDAFAWATATWRGTCRECVVHSETPSDD